MSVYSPTQSSALFVESKSTDYEYGENHWTNPTGGRERDPLSGAARRVDPRIDFTFHISNERLNINVLNKKQFTRTSRLMFLAVPFINFELFLINQLTEVTVMLLCKQDLFKNG